MADLLTQTDKGHSSAVASVLYSRGGTHPAETTKSGSYVFSGDASAYHEWEFRTRLRIKAAGDEPRFYAEAMSKVVDGLRGEAFVVAKEIGSRRYGNLAMKIYKSSQV